MPSVRCWKRPENVPFPSIWRRCTGRRVMADGKLPKFVVQDVPDDRMEDVVDFMCTYYIKDGVFCGCAGLSRDPISVQELRTQWLERLKQRATLVAFVDDEPGTPRIAGCNVTYVLSKDDQETDQIKGVAMRVFSDATKYVRSRFDVFSHYGVDEYLVGMGLSVSPEFRGQGLGLELLLARYDIGRALNVRATAALFSAIQSQTAAAQSGMEVLLDIPYEDYKVDGKVVFAVDFPKSMKLMGTKIE